MPSSAHHQFLPSFPTRRSSDLTTPRGDLELFLPLARNLVGMSLITSQPLGEDGFFMLLLAPGRAETAAVRRDLVAVLDVSGSMSRSEEHTSELQSLTNLVCRLLLTTSSSRLSLHDALPILRPREGISSCSCRSPATWWGCRSSPASRWAKTGFSCSCSHPAAPRQRRYAAISSPCSTCRARCRDRKSTRLNSSH